MKKVYELISDESFIDDIELKYLGIKFYGEKYPTLRECLEDINEFDFDKLDMTKTMLKAIKFYGIKKSDLKRYFNYEYKEKWIIENYISEILDYIDNDLYDKELKYTDFLNELGYDFGTVGYSNWSYVLVKKDLEWSFVRDLYEGLNFYSLTQYDVVDNELIHSDSYGGLYLNSNDDLKNALTAFTTDIESVLFVENDIIRYFDFKTIKKYDITRSYILNKESV